MSASAASSDGATLTHLGELEEAFVHAKYSLLDKGAVATCVQSQQVVVNQAQGHLGSQLGRRRSHLAGLLASLVVQVILVVQVGAVVDIRISLLRKKGKTKEEDHHHHHHSVPHQAESVDELRSRNISPVLGAHIFGDEVERDGRNPSECQERVRRVLHLHGLHPVTEK